MLQIQRYSWLPSLIEIWGIVFVLMFCFSCDYFLTRIWKLVCEFSNLNAHDPTIRLLHFKVTNSIPSIGPPSIQTPLMKEIELVSVGMGHGKGQVRGWRLIGEELSKKIKQWVHHILKIFVKSALQKSKSIRSLWSIYCLPRWRHWKL